jgi:hypothetical protein
MAQTLALASSDGRFNVTVSGDDVELVASVLLLLEVLGSDEGDALDADREVA